MVLQFLPGTMSEGTTKKAACEQSCANARGRQEAIRGECYSQRGQQVQSGSISGKFQEKPEGWLSFARIIVDMSTEFCLSSEVAMKWPKYFSPFEVTSLYRNA